jgi:signal transduction histidine kinase
MKKDGLITQLVFIAVLLVAVPAALLYYYDNERVVQLNAMQSKILWSENQKEVEVIKAQVTKKLDEITNRVEGMSEKNVTAKYAAVFDNKTIKNSSYSNKAAVEKIREQFIKAAKGADADLILLFRNGNIVAANKPELNKLSFKGNTKFLQTIPSQKMASEINFTDGTVEFFAPVNDSKQRLVSVFYIKENIAGMSRAIRNERQSPHGYNFIIDSAGRMLLNSDQSKEGSENVLSNPDIKAVLDEDAGDSNIREASYNNLKGLMGFKKIKPMDFIVCVFTPYTDYAFMKKKTKMYESSLNDTTFIMPVYGILAALLILGIIMIAGISGSPFKPLSKIVKALTHIDEEGFQQLLPRIRSGEYKKLIDSLVILKGRISAAEEKTQKLSQMSKELEEELSKEASRSDAEISELRDAVKIAENNKASLEDRLAKSREESEREKKDAVRKMEGEKALLEQKVSVLSKESGHLKTETKKGQETGVQIENENMRTDSVLMMNTELKGVLSVIKTYISSVLGGEGKITDAQQQFLGVVINKSARLERLINDLTELAKLEKGDIKLVRQPVEINNIIQDIIFAIQPQADIKKVELKVNFAPTLPTAVGDPSRLSSAASQFLNQAIKVSPRGGQIIVETKDGGRDVLIRITDFGMSMPQSKSNVLFVNFHGPESAAGPEFVNTGLRFPILKAVVNNMGGDIWIESEIGKGKTFIISLPKEQGAAASKPGLRAEAEIKPFGIKTAEPVKPLASLKVTTPAAPAQPGGFKIQRNDAGKNEEPLPTVTELLNFDVPLMDRKVNLPGRDVKVPQDLLKREPVKPAQGKKEEVSMPLPDELPPLPELEDDKGSDIIK